MARVYLENPPLKKEGWEDLLLIKSPLTPLRQLADSKRGIIRGYLDLDFVFMHLVQAKTRLPEARRNH